MGSENQALRIQALEALLSSAVAELGSARAELTVLRTEVSRLRPMVEDFAQRLFATLPWLPWAAEKLRRHGEWGNAAALETGYEQGQPKPTPISRQAA